MRARSPLPTAAAAVVSAVALAACVDGTTVPTGGANAPTQAVAWISEHAIPFNTSVAGGPTADLAPVKAIVGDARIVSLGEATHGTREFFEMKHRMLELLVKEMGFTTFAIESEWAEAARLDRYVQTGEGNPQALLTGLYFWTWRTQEVLDMIRWMRAWNANPANARKVSFVGVDAQFPTLAMDTTVAFLRRADPAWAPIADQRYACFRPYSNQARGASPLEYRAAGAAKQTECRTGVQEVYAYLAARRAELEAKSSPAEYSFALQAARLAVQGEEVRSERDAGARDRYMAENAAWWLERGGAGAKMVLWAHNAHVSTGNGWMGSHLRARYGQAMRIFGFSFYRGAFTAVNLDGGPFGTYVFGPAPLGTYELLFHATGKPRFVLDLRIAEGRRWLGGPLLVREIGCCVQPSVVDYGIRSQSLPALYDAIIFFDVTSESRPIAPIWEQ